MKTRSLCQNCQYREHQDMLTTYCIKSCRCDGCKRIGDLAITRKPPEYQQWGDTRIRLNWGTP